MQCIWRSRNRCLQKLHALAKTQSLCEELLSLQSLTSAVLLSLQARELKTQAARTPSELAMTAPVIHEMA
jgi:hypothetical protein